MTDTVPTGPAGADSTAAPEVTALGQDVYQIDTRMSGYRGITAGYLIRGSRPCLVETGTATSAPVVQAALHGLGIGPRDLTTIVVTHIHLDHAGGAGDLARAFPAAEIVVHERGARHLADPRRLMAGAREVFGNDVVDRVFGPLLPCAADRIRSVGATGTVDIGDGRHLAAHHSPGHARHHLGLVDSATGDLYVGDAAGIHIPETADLRPATPPPDFDLGAALDSLRLFADLGPTRLLFSHYGPVTAVAETLARSGEELRAWVDTVRRSRAVRGDLDHAVAMVRERMRERQPGVEDNANVRTKFEALSPVRSNVQGISRWLDRTA